MRLHSPVPPGTRVLPSSMHLAVLAILLALGACSGETPIPTAPEFAALEDDCDGEIFRDGCEDPPPEECAPGQCAPPTGPWTADQRWGVEMSITWSYCITSSGDADSDGLRDFCEAQLAERFAPRLYFHPGEDCRTREPYYAARVSDAMQRKIRIFYALAYHMDCGGVTSGGGHFGDSEFLVVELRNDGADVWVTDRLYTSAHRDEALFDRSGWTGWQSLPWQDVSGGRAKVMVSENKHANFVSYQACSLSPPDTCSWGGTSQSLSADRILTTSLNLGRSGDRLIDCVSSRIRFPPSAYRDECFWTTTYKFYGWYLYRWGKGSTAYGTILPEFGF